MDWKQHAKDIIKGLIAAMVMAAAQAAISYISGLHWNTIISFALQSGAALAMIKTGSKI
ncbi:MAG: hypothetical protein KGJ58_01680 [Patescibacteria group bacterium]|nr:hypothetical protein [Patescibacteria group bacterium]MDE1988641.1 hypothetical protein [Patescibacteria group bacterium]MDE2218149.1 hypothetical protein [Patescibacteria group bacterium]